jgi:hypothetical protein
MISPVAPILPFRPQRSRFSENSIAHHPDSVLSSASEACFPLNPLFWPGQRGVHKGGNGAVGKYLAEKTEQCDLEINRYQEFIPRAPG